MSREPCTRCRAPAYHEVLVSLVDGTVRQYMCRACFASFKKMMEAEGATHMKPVRGGDA